MHLKSFLKRWLLAGLCCVLYFQADAQSNFHQYIQHAETYYWLGIYDQGDPDAFEKALQFLDKAEAAISIDPEAPDSAGIYSATQQIDLLRLDLNEQISIARNNFVGTFPLVRFMGITPLLNTSAFGSIELFEGPGEVAIERAAQETGDLFSASFLGNLLVPVVVLSEDHAYPDLESKARATLNASPRLRAYQTQYVLKSLSPDEINLLFEEALSQELLVKLKDVFHTGIFAITIIRFADQVDDVHYFHLQTRVYSDKSIQPLQVISKSEIIRDKRSTMGLFTIVFLFLLFATVAIYLVNCRLTSGQKTSLLQVISGPVMAFAIGFLTTLIALSFFAVTMPEFQNFFGYTFWWVPVAFIMIMFIPLFIIRNFILRFSFYQGIIDVSSKLGILFSAAALGVVAFLSLGLLLYHGLNGLLYIAAAGVSLGAIAYINGKALDRIKPLPMRLAVWAVVLLPFSGMAIAANVLHYLWIPVLTALGLMVATRLIARKKKAEKPRIQTEASGQITIEHFLRLTENPPFFTPAGFDLFYSKCLPFLEHKTRVLCITGGEGTGKTATAHELIRRLIDENKEVLVLTAQCPEKNNTPYQPIQQALLGFVNLGEAGEAHGHIQEIDNVLDNLLESFVPFAGLITADTRSKRPNFNTQAELFHNIFTTLKKQSRKHPLVFFLDDLHWADTASLELLTYLHKEFQDANDHPILFLYTARPFESVDTLFKSDQVEAIKKLTREERFELLTNHLGVDRETARLVLEWVSSDHAMRGGLFWMYKLLEHLARHGHLIETPEGLKLEQGILQTRKIPVPNEYRLALREELKQFREQEKYLAMAACLGLEFEVSVLAAGLGIDRLQCLETLQNLENESNIIYDVPEKDDLFAFTSSFTLETLRQELQLGEAGPKGKMKEIVREYHARIGTMLEKNKPAGNTLRIAHHYYAAGRNYAVPAVQFLLGAAKHCVNVFRFDEAQRYLDKADEMSEYTPDPGAYDLQMLLIACDISMLAGKDFHITADQCEAFLASDPEPDMEALLKFASAFYYAQRFDRAAAVGRLVIEKAQDQLTQAKGYHLLGISLSYKEFADKRIENLEEALQLALGCQPRTHECLRVTANIHNSLGEDYTSLAQRDPSAKEKAKGHFEESIRIKGLKEINDTPGLARSHGGLGRLELFVPPVNPDLALEHFEKDLQLSEQIGDMLGQTKMHSLIGKCHLLKGDPEPARASYQRSLEMSELETDKVFSLLGLLEVFDNGPDEPWGREKIEEMHAILRQTDFIPPHFLKEELLRFFRQARKKEHFAKLSKSIN
jgi:tetratricopeptide (TPR) repeat protein